MLIHLTVFITKLYITELNRSTLNDVQLEKHLNANNSLKINTLVNIGDWKNTLESVDMKQFTMNPLKLNEEGCYLFINSL